MRILLVLVFISFMSCGVSKSDKIVKNNSADGIGEETVDTIRIANDSLEYEIIIFEVGFQSWLATQRPPSFYSLPMLEMRNYFMVVEYNNRVNQPFRFDPNLYVQAIDYRPDIHYGMEVNYLLYMYFNFFEQRYKQDLAPGRMWN
ncbi:DUF6146 family protein [Namhaeicola litoreus]|uniref:DUF6146 family protein n=1 Tax=Namhaeicola litoreus TaxID=1052145 RepID=A0ABW3Y6C7_9FLAO